MGRVKTGHSLGKSTQSKYSRHHNSIYNLISQTPTTRLGSFPKKVIIQGFNCAQIYLEQKETHGAGFGSVYSTAAPYPQPVIGAQHPALGVLCPVTAAQHAHFR